jgi:hypothetical protein
MTEIVASRVTGGIEGDFVVFLIGMRINKPWKVLKWLPVARAMPKMLKAAPPETAFLGHNGFPRSSCNTGAASIIWSATRATLRRCIGRPGSSSTAA